MKKIPEKFLPVGTVVMLHEGTKRIMITGFCVFEMGDDNSGEKKLWDYCGCLYPEGVLSTAESFLFDHNQIKDIYHLGLDEDEDAEEKEFKRNLKNFLSGNNEIIDTDSSQDNETNNDGESEANSNDNAE